MLGAYVYKGIEIEANNCSNDIQKLNNDFLNDNSSMVTRYKSLININHMNTKWKHRALEGR